MTSESDRWYDDAAGPVVRPYAMTRGRTSHAAEAKIDLIALVVTEEESGSGSALEDDQTLSPEHLDIIERCRQQATSVAELAADLDLPVGVVRVWRGANVAMEAPVYAAEAIATGSTMRRAVDGVSELVIGMFRASAEKL